MTETGKTDRPAAARDRRPMVFRKKSSVPPPTREQARRQSAIIQSAWSHFGEAAPMIAFLNSPNETLHVQPLALAIASDDGLERVERLLRELPLKC